MEYIKEEADTDHSDNINSVYSEQRMMKTETLDITNSTFDQEYLPHFERISTSNIKEQIDNESLGKVKSLPSNLQNALEDGKRYRT